MGWCWKAERSAGVPRGLAGAQAWCGSHTGSGTVAGLTWQPPVLRAELEGGCSLPAENVIALGEYSWLLWLSSADGPFLRG